MGAINLCMALEGNPPPAILRAPPAYRLGDAEIVAGAVQSALHVSDLLLHLLRRQHRMEEGAVTRRCRIRPLRKNGETDKRQERSAAVTANFDFCHRSRRVMILCEIAPRPKLPLRLFSTRLTRRFRPELAAAAALLWSCDSLRERKACCAEYLLGPPAHFSLLSDTSEDRNMYGYFRGNKSSYNQTSRQDSYRDLLRAPTQRERASEAGGTVIPPNVVFWSPSRERFACTSILAM